ncbi:MAG: S8 family serine peptidase, partial [Clostridia bacterium]|nr:S8 family serine peptidase [Clostridia bacterium]
MKYIRPARALSAALASLLLLTPAASSLPGYSPTVTVMVDTDGTDAASLLACLSGAELLNEYSLIHTFSATVREDQLPLLTSIPGVLSVSPEAIFNAPQTMGNSLFGPADIDERDQVLRAEDSHFGEGSVIAVLDTGFDVTHPSFAMPKGITPVIEKEDIPALTADTYVIFRQTREKIEETYVSRKIPFAYDYADTDTDVFSEETHGTHVAATAAGSGDLYGVAPGAQLLLMKVFADDTKTCDEQTLLMAIEDAVKLGADVINLSLGTLSMSSTYIGMGRLAGAIRGAQSKGVTVICAVGNDGFAGSGGAVSDFFRATDPDYGLLSEPAVIDGTVAVGAAVNRILYAGYVEVGGRKMVYDFSNEMSLGQIPTFSDV